MKIAALLFTIFALVASTLAVKKARCGLEHSMPGVCSTQVQSWSYRADTNECVWFAYGGSGGNANRFKTLEQCENICKE